MKLLVGDPDRATPQYTRFAILAALGRWGLRRTLLQPDLSPNHRLAQTLDTAVPVEWPPLETDRVQRSAANPLCIDPARFNASLTGQTLGAQATSIRREFDPLRSFRQGPARYRLQLADGRSLGVILKASLRGLEQEAWFYEQFSQHLQVHVPRLYGVLRGQAGEEPNWLILQLLRGQSPASTLTAEDLRLALNALVNLHAQFWDNSLLDRYGWLPVATNCDTLVFLPRLELALDAIWSRQHSLEFFPKLFDRHIKLGLERIGNDLEPMLVKLRSLSSTLLHGDLTIYNIIFTQGPAGDVDSVALLDWQDVCRGPAIIDLVLFYNAHLFRHPYHALAKRSAPLIPWDEFANYYFDALERRLGRSVDRAAQIAAAPAVNVLLALRRFLVCAGLTLSAGQLDFLFSKKRRISQWLAAWADFPGFLEYFVNFPLELVTAHASEIYGRDIFG